VLEVVERGTVVLLYLLSCTATMIATSSRKSKRGHLGTFPRAGILSSGNQPLWGLKGPGEEKREDALSRSSSKAEDSSYEFEYVSQRRNTQQWKSALQALEVVWIEPHSDESLLK
jgi:hypothetical protein